MTSIQFSELLIDINLYVGFVPIIVAIWLWRYQSLPLKIFAINQICLSLIFILSILLQKNNIPNHFVNTLHNIRFSIFIPLMLWFYDKRQFLLIISAIALFISILPTIFKIQEWNPFSDTIITAIGISILLFYFRNIVSKSTTKLTNIPIFWIIGSLIIGGIFGLISTYFSKQALNYSTEVFLIIWNILSIIGIICKLLYAVGFYVSKQKIFQ